MYRVIFKHRFKQGQIDSYTKQWQKGSDVIQSYPGALGTKLFRNPNDPEYLYAMADWDSKKSRNEAIESIKARPDADWVLHKHEDYLETHEILGTFELIAESKPPISK